jgi:nucleoside-diphosphate-sugar epimerase
MVRLVGTDGANQPLRWKLPLPLTSPRTMNVFLAGATGVIGRPSTKILVARGHRVFAMTRQRGLESEIWAAGAIPVVQDAFDAEGLERRLHAIKPDAVIHQLTDLALLQDAARIRDALERNARLREIGTANLVAAAVSAGVGHMVAQSIAWFYRSGPEPHVEDAPLDLNASGLVGISVGGVTALERAVLSTAGVHGCVLRYGQLYGPGTGSDDVVDGPVPLHVEAAAWASVLALEQRAAGVYNVCEPNPHVSTEKIRRDLGWNEGLRA